MSTAYITTKSIREYNRVKINIALCEARHQMPEHVTGSIFPNTVDPLDIEGINRYRRRFYVGTRER